LIEIKPCHSMNADIRRYETRRKAPCGIFIIEIAHHPILQRNENITRRTYRRSRGTVSWFRDRDGDRLPSSGLGHPCRRLDSGSCARADRRQNRPSQAVGADRGGTIYFGSGRRHASADAIACGAALKHGRTTELTAPPINQRRAPRLISSVRVRGGDQRVVDDGDPAQVGKQRAS